MDERPWEQQDDEPVLWFDRFEQYRLLGPTRTVMAVYNDFRAGRGKGRAKTPPQSWTEATHRWRWKDRARAWDMSLVQRRQEEWEEERSENKRQRLALLGSFRAKMTEAVALLDPTDIRWAEAVAGLKMVLAESRAEYNDEPIQRIETGDPGDFDLLAATLDSKLARLAAEAGAVPVPIEPDPPGEG